MSFLSTCILAACAHAPGKPLARFSNENCPPIAAMFATRIEETATHAGSKVHRWRFWRSADRIETLETSGNTGEAWFKSPDQQISYERIFHSDKQVLEYTPGDLKALGDIPDWRALATLVDTRLLHGLKAQGSADLLGLQATRYLGETKDGTIEIWWLEEQQIPAMIKRTSPEGVQTTVLAEIHPLSESPWPLERRGRYRYTDYADIGDKENDPFVKSILHRIKGRHSHSR